MNRWERIKKLFSLGDYLRRLAYFVVLGISIFLGALIVKDPFWNDVLVQLSIVFIAVGFVSIVWDIVGGDPMELQMVRLFSSLDTKVISIQRSMGILSDIIEGDIGIERIWPTRREWERDPEDGLAVWKERLCKAQRVDIVSNTFWTRWFHDEAFRKKLFESIAQGSTARILIYDPDSDVLALRSHHENDSKRKGVSEMESEIGSTLKRVVEGVSELGDTFKGKLQLRLTNRYYHLAQIIRADDQMLIAIYLAGKTGSPSPTLQLKGPDSVYFQTYKEQIDIYWDGAREVNQDEFHSILVQYHNDK